MQDRLKGAEKDGNNPTISQDRGGIIGKSTTHLGKFSWPLTREKNTTINQINNEIQQQRNAVGGGRRGGGEERNNAN